MIKWLWYLPLQFYQICYYRLFLSYILNFTVSDMSSYADIQYKLEKELSKGAALMKDIIRCDAITAQKGSQTPNLFLHRLIQERIATRIEFYTEAGQQMSRLNKMLTRQKSEDEELLHDLQMMESMETVSIHNLKIFTDRWPPLIILYMLMHFIFSQMILLINHPRYLSLYSIPKFSHHQHMYHLLFFQMHEMIKLERVCLVYIFWELTKWEAHILRFCYCRMYCLQISYQSMQGK